MLPVQGVGELLCKDLFPKKAYQLKIYGTPQSGKGLEFFKKFLISHPDILKSKFNDSERKNYLQLYGDLIKSIENEQVDVDKILAAFVGIDSFHKEVVRLRESLYTGDKGQLGPLLKIAPRGEHAAIRDWLLKPEGTPFPSPTTVNADLQKSLARQRKNYQHAHQSYLESLRNQILFSEEFLFAISNFVIAGVISEAEGAKHAQVLYHLTKKYLQEKGDAFEEVIEERAGKKIGILVIGKSTNHRIEKMQTVIKKAHGKDMRLVYSPEHQFYSRNSEWVRQNEQGITANALILPRDKLLSNDEGHEYRHGYIQGLLNKGVESVYHGDIVFNRSGVETGILGYEQGLSFEEVSTHGYDIRASITSLRDAKTPQEIVQEREKLFHNAEKGQNISIKLAKHLENAAQVVSSLEKAQKETAPQLELVSISYNRTNQRDLRPSEGVGIIKQVENLKFEEHPSVVFSIIKSADPAQDARWVQASIANQEGLVINIPLMGAQALKLAEKITADTSSGILPEHLTLMQLTRETLLNKKEKFDGQAKEFENVFNVANRHPPVTEAADLIEAVRAFKLHPIQEKK